MFIGITGKARAGKDTFAKMLAEELYKATGKKFILMAYAHELKLRVQRDFDLSYDQLWGDDKEVIDTRYKKSDAKCDDLEFYWTGREILQAYGQFFRTINNEFWVNSLFRTIEEKEYANVIITDIRHPNEATPISDRDGFVIRVNSERSDKEAIHGSNHISETIMDSYVGIDFDVRNDGELSELRQAAVQVVKFITGNKNDNRNIHDLGGKNG